MIGYARTHARPRPDIDIWDANSKILSVPYRCNIFVKVRSLINKCFTSSLHILILMFQYLGFEWSDSSSDCIYVKLYYRSWWIYLGPTGYRGSNKPLITVFVISEISESHCSLHLIPHHLYNIQYHARSQTRQQVLTHAWVRMYTCPPPTRHRPMGC